MRYILYLFIGLLGYSQIQAQPVGNAQRKAGNVNYSQQIQNEAGNVNYSIGNLDYNNDYTERVSQNVLPQAQVTNPNMLQLDVRIMSNQQADRYVAIFSLTQAGKTTEETNSLMQKRANSFKEKLKAAGIPDTDVLLDLISFVPLYEYEVEKKLFSKNNIEVPKGYELQQNIHVAFTTAQQFDAMLKAAAELGIFDLVKIDYTVDDQEAVYTEMRERAVANLNEQLKLYEQQLGIELTDARRTLAEAKKVIFPLDRYSSYKAFANVSTEQVTQRGKTRDMYKPMTYYYDKVVASDMDVVINPHVVEPVVQYLYHLQVSIQLPNPKVEQPEKAFFWLTPEGEVVPVQPSSK